MLRPSLLEAKVDAWGSVPEAESATVCSAKNKFSIKPRWVFGAAGEHHEKASAPSFAHFAKGADTTNSDTDRRGESLTAGLQ